MRILRVVSFDDDHNNSTPHEVGRLFTTILPPSLIVPYSALPLFLVFSPHLLLAGQSRDRTGLLQAIVVVSPHENTEISHDNTNKGRKYRRLFQKLRQ